MGIAVATAPREERVPVRNGLQIFIRSSIPAAKPRAIVGIVHGVKSHSGYYRWAATQLVAQGFAVYALDSARTRPVGRRTLLPRADVGLRRRRPRARHAGQEPASVGAVLPARAQRRRRGFLRLHARTSGGAGGLHLRELRVPGLRAGPRARRRQGAEPRRAARARAEPEDRGLLARSGGGAGDARRSADRGRIAADQHRRRARPRRRAAEAGVPAHHAAGADPARHRGQGHATGRQPVLLRDGGLHATRR